MVRVSLHQRDTSSVGQGVSVILIDRLEKMYSDTSILEKKSRWVTLEEARLLLKLCLIQQPEVIFESGTANGFSTMWLSVVGVPVYTFDPVDRTKLWDNLGIINITYVKDKFSSVVFTYSELSSCRKAFFIDGDHSSSGVQSDCAAVKQYAKVDDIVIFHDLNEKPVMRAWHRLQKYSQSIETYPTKRIMGKLVWGE